MRTLAGLLTLSALLVATAPARADFRPSKPVALVYRGPGSCAEGCSEAAAYVAQRAGYYTIYVGPQDAPAQFFTPGVAVWVQPGGKSTAVAEAMSAELKDAIRAFVRGGGGYVGFCAGGFLATDLIGDSAVPGLGLIPGRSSLYTQVKDDATLLALTWTLPGIAASPRQTYWEGGPFFHSGPPGAPGAPEVVATYPDGTAASVRHAYGQGRVFVTGAHPEAPQGWRNFNRLQDADGLDYDLAVAMLQWVRGL